MWPPSNGLRGLVLAVAAVREHDCKISLDIGVMLGYHDLNLAVAIVYITGAALVTGECVLM